jgi:hypothetical protein
MSVETEFISGFSIPMGISFMNNIKPVSIKPRALMMGSVRNFDLKYMWKLIMLIFFVCKCKDCRSFKTSLPLYDQANCN